MTGRADPAGAAGAITGPPAATGAKLAFRIALVTAAYAVTGYFGLKLAIPPGYATAVWPASGIALAAVLLGGARLAPGVFLGSLLVNAPTAFDPGAALASLAIPGALALGAALQAVFGAMLVRRYVGAGRLLIQDLDIVRLMLLGGPLACTVNPLFGVGTLWLAGSLEPGVAWLNLLTWWVGDTIGVLVFTPLVLVWASRPYAVWLPRQLFVTLPLAALFVAVVALFFFVSEREQSRVASEFAGRAASIAGDLRRQLATAVSSLGLMEGFYASSGGIGERQFGIFAGPMLETLPAAIGLAWVEPIDHAQRITLERTTQPGGAAVFRVTDRDRHGRLRVAGMRAEYAVVRYVVPRSGNEAVIGFDMLSEAARRMALERARDTGSVSLTGRVLLAQQQRGLPGMLALMPIYRRGADAGAVAGRRAALAGYVSAIFRLDLLMEGTVAALRREGLRVTLFDDTGGENRPIYRYPARPGEVEASGGLRHDERVAIAGRALRLGFELPANVLLARKSWATHLVLAGGLLLTGLFGMLLLLGVGRAARVQALVEQGTAELRRLNASLVAEAQRRRRLEQEAAKRADELAGSNAELQRREEVNRQLLASLRSSEEELRRTAAQLSASNLELEQFAYVASHDLKAPLRSIGSFAQLLERRHGHELDGDAREFLAFIQDGIRQMGALIDDLLQLSRVDARRLEPGPVSMQAVVERACRQLTADLEATRAVVHVGELPELHADFNMLVQLLQNLIGNALKFQPPGQRPEVWIDCAPTGAFWRFSVRDNGIGIEPQHLGQMFMVFKRLHAPERYPGTGIGLAICKKVVGLHGGEISVESTLGVGTTIHFTLPQGTPARPAAPGSAG